MTTIQIFIKTLSGKTLTLDVLPKSTTLDLKRSIELTQGIPPDFQRLLFNGK